MVQGSKKILSSVYLKSAEEAAKQSRSILLSHFGRLSSVSHKEQAGLVTVADVQSEQTIKEFLLKAHPEVKFLGEEESFENPNLGLTSSGLLWVVDPLDGTTNYVHNFPIFCISIGLMREGVVEAAVIDVPMLDRTYTAVKGEGAFLNGRPIKVSRRQSINDSLLATGFFAENKPALDQQLKIFNDMIRNARGVRRAGAAAFDLCMVAEGVFDGFWEKNLKPWDTCAGSLLVAEAGGQVTNYEGDEFHPSMNSILATNSLIQNELLKVTSSHLVEG